MSLLKRLQTAMDATTIPAKNKIIDAEDLRTVIEVLRTIDDYPNNANAMKERLKVVLSQ